MSLIFSKLETSLKAVMTKVQNGEYVQAEIFNVAALANDWADAIVDWVSDARLVLNSAIDTASGTPDPSAVGLQLVPQTAALRAALFAGLLADFSSPTPTFMAATIAAWNAGIAGMVWSESGYVAPSGVVAPLLILFTHSSEIETTASLYATAFTTSIMSYVATAPITRLPTFVAIPLIVV